MTTGLDDANLDQLTRDCAHARADVFGDFYWPFLSACALRLREWEREWEPEFAESTELAQVAASLLPSVMDSLVAIGTRTLITTFRGQSALDYKGFHEWAGGTEGRDTILARFPELHRLLTLITERQMSYAEEVLRAAWRDRASLEAVLGVRGRVTRITMGMGDSHCGGRTVSRVSWSNGMSAVYKPQHESCQKLLAEVRRVVDEDGAFFGPLYPRAVISPTHLWQEYIQYAELDESAGPGRYFRLFGRAAALFSMLGAGDLHLENVIALPAGPVLLDPETLVSLLAREEFGALVLDINNSVLNTLMFPARYKGAALDVDISAIGCPDPTPSHRLKTFVVVDAGTDGIRFEHVPVVMNHGTNMAAVNGEPVDPRLWMDEILTGFEEARELLAANRDAIRHVASRVDGWSVRHIPRPTFLYARFLEASTHPAYLTSRESREEFLAQLPRQHQGIATEVTDAVHDEEVRALLDLDVPFFGVRCDSRDLQLGRRAEVENGVLGTPRQSLLARIDGFFGRPVRRDLAYITYSLASSSDDVWKARPVRRRAGARHRDVLPDLNDPRPWIAALRDLVVGDGDTPSFLMPQLDGEGLRLGAANTLLHEGGGLLLYLARSAAVDGHTAFGWDVGKIYAAAHPLRIGEAVTPLTVSPFTGILSRLVTGLELRRCGVGIPGDGWTGEDVGGASGPDRALSLANQVEAERLSKEDFDYLNGFGGYAVFLSEYYGDRVPAVAEAAAGRLLRRLVEVDGPPEEQEGDLGLVHGRFGRIAAMSALVAAGADTDGRAREHLTRFASAYLRGRWTDDCLRDPARRAGWCKGYAGVAFAATKLLAAVGYSDAQIRDAITPEVEGMLYGDPGDDISFCHGVAGRLALTCWLAGRLSWPELRDEAKDLSSRFIERSAEAGWRCGIGPIAGLPSFFFGLSGWYYAQLMIEAPAIGLPLCLGGR
ncbi:type 2 lanthipeptide synthetase LanM [Microbispora sp. NPDC088329]|uniref:type 2 lanthipeptide synthetase LanM n=1 Tax=Microbispora sp. NPDC088329 TaxID=3154869 RepID=UPI0034379EC4